MSKFYTHVTKYGDKLLIRGYKDGIQFKDKVDYTPTLYVQDGNQNSDSNIKTLDGKKVKSVQFESMSEAKKFLDKYKDVAGFSIYGNSAFPYQWMSDTYSRDVPWEPEHITTYSLDIETSVEFGFPDDKNPREEILLITIHNKKSNRYRVFTAKKFATSRKNVDIVYCHDERDMLIRFTEFMYNNPPDVITGWNIKFFDIPYLCSRIDRVLDGDEAYVKRLSPWGVVWSREVNNFGRTYTTYELLGVSCLDYLDLYKKYIKTPRESYKLGYIGEVELDLPKIDNPYSTFKAFYESDWDLFAEYNIRDVEIVDKLEDKLKLIELQMTTAYMSKVNYEDIFGQVKVWETIIYNHLRKKNVVVKADRSVSRAANFEGAYVKAPIIGKHKNIVSFDLDSLYPHLIMQYGISPETLVSGFNNFRDITTVDKLLNQEIDTSILKELNYSLTANGVCYNNSVLGFLPELMKSMYADRKAYKKKMLAKQQEYEKNPSFELEKEIAKLHNLQLALKINLNSLYGALGNVTFKYFDIRLSEGITTSGQLSIRWIANKLNETLNRATKLEKDRVIYCDTDSVYVCLDDIVSKAKEKNPNLNEIEFMDRFCEEKIQPFINKSFNDLSQYMNSYENAMSMKRESLCDVGIFVAKKKYMLNVYNSEGVQYEKPKLKTVGLEIVKSSTPEIVKGKLKEAIDILLFKENSDLLVYIDKTKKEYFKYTPEQIATSKGVNDIEKYYSNTSIQKGTPINVRASIVHNRLVESTKTSSKYKRIESGDKIKMIYLKTPNHIQQNIIGFADKLPEEFGLNSFVDYSTMFDKTFLSAVEIMATSLGWTLKEESNLKAYF